jgi:hypothetical protein
VQAPADQKVAFPAHPSSYLTFRFAFFGLEGGLIILLEAAAFLARR